MTYRKRQCECGAWITTNALGRAAHRRACPGSPIQRELDRRLRRERFAAALQRFMSAR